MVKTTERINLWSGPRNISTALMYSFAQRLDTNVYDEPLYGYYLNQTQADSYHPGARKVLEDMELDSSKVIEMMKAEHGKRIAFFKQMTHHLYELDYSFMDGMTNVILTRNPVDMLPSFAKEIENPTMEDVGYSAHLELIEYLKSTGQKIVVLDSKRILENPRVTLEKLCQEINIPFEESMLSWKAGSRPEDGSWAQYWYKSVHKSTGFNPYKPKSEQFPKNLQPLLEKCKPIYETLLELAL